MLFSQRAIRRGSMVTNKDAYVRLERASEDALEGAEKAISAEARLRLLDLSRAFDTELADMVARGLIENDERYRPLTTEFRISRDDIERVATDTKQFVETDELVMQIGTSFARVLTMLL
jgi:hypothetical protein